VVVRIDKGRSNGATLLPIIAVALLLICADSAAFICRVSIQITGRPLPTMRCDFWPGLEAVP
jgi:hypothetical protein